MLVGKPEGGHVGNVGIDRRVILTLISLNSINQLIFVMVKCGVLFEVRTEFLNNILMSFRFIVLIKDYTTY
jgi:hypothetical protein